MAFASNATLREAGSAPVVTAGMAAACRKLMDVWCRVLYYNIAICARASAWEATAP
jgi:hypothetical protein